MSVKTHQGLLAESPELQSGQIRALQADVLLPSLGVAQLPFKPWQCQLLTLTKKFKVEGNDV